jgi:hypothetical protein
MDSSFAPGLTAPQSEGDFTHVWPFDFSTTASYTYDPTRLDFTGGVCRLTPSAQTDNASTPFSSGVAAGTTWDTAREVLRLDASGTPTNQSELDASWTPQYSSIAGYWKLNGSGAITAGDTINAVIGPSLTKVGAGAMSYADGKVNQGILFPNTTTQYATGGLTSNRTANFTMSVWFYWNGVIATNAVLFANGTGGTNGYGIIIGNGAGGAGNRLGVIRNGTSWDVFDSLTVMPTGVWTHIAVTKGAIAGSWTLYLNGHAVKTGTGTPTVPTATSYIASGNVNGIIDEIAYWNTLLTATEIRQIYERQAPKFAGTYTSHVMNARAAGQSWTSLDWTTSLPFEKELPDAACAPTPCAHTNDETSTNYPSLVGSTGAVGDNDLLGLNLQGLWHFQEPAGTTGAGTVIDDSGKGRNLNPGNITFGSWGRLGTGAFFNGTTAWMNGTDVLNPGNGSYTASAWFRRSSNAAPAGAQSIFSKGNASSAAEGWNVHLSTDARLYARVNASNDATEVAGRNTTGTFLNMDWHHVVLVIDRTNAVLRTYIDGTSAGWTTGAPGPASDSISGFGDITTANTLAIGADRSGVTTNHYFAGWIDEVAIWDRALTAAEVLQLYRRGANRARFQVRTCTTADCSDDALGTNWKGPDGTRYTFFSELNNNSVPLAANGNVLKGLPSLILAGFTSPVGTSQYFQYRTILESDDKNQLCTYGGAAAACSPEIRSVRITPDHYDSSNSTVVGIAGPAFSSLSSFASTASTCPSGIGYNLGVGASAAVATWYYWDATKASDCTAAGSGAWCAADGTVTKSNTATEIQSKISSFAGKAGSGTAYFKAFLRSSGTSACEIDSVTLGGAL